MSNHVADTYNIAKKMQNEFADLYGVPRLHDTLQKINIKYEYHVKTDMIF